MSNVPVEIIAQPPVEAALETPEVATVLKALANGAPFVGLLIDGVDRRAAVLEAVLDRVADAETKLAWVGNPLRSPLTIERLFLQATGPEADVRVERDPAQLARMLAGPADEKRRTLIVVQQPETMDAETRELLSGIGSHLRSAATSTQLLFVSGTSFRVPPCPHLASVDDEIVSARRLHALPVLLLLALGVIGVLASTSPALHRDLLDAAHRVLGSAVTLAPAEPATAAVTSQAETAPTADTVALRNEFDQFLAQRATTLPNLTPAQKDELFQEFLTRHRQRAP